MSIPFPEMYSVEAWRQCARHLGEAVPTRAYVDTWVGHMELATLVSHEKVKLAAKACEMLARITELRKEWNGAIPDWIIGMLLHYGHFESKVDR